jgi:protein-tyrosine phosphatase
MVVLPESGSTEREPPGGRYLVVDWTGCRNFRDLGGLPTEDGGQVRANALLRSDAHDGLAAATIQAIRDGAVSRIVDLRWTWECERNPSPFVAHQVYRHVPMLSEVLEYVPPPDSYGPMLDHNQQRIGAAFRTVADAPPGAVVVHCHAGRDRTGVLIALLLEVAGVQPQKIAEDYALSEDCSADTMLNTLAHLDHRYGGATSYLTTIGISGGTLHAVRGRLLEPTTPRRPRMDHQ